MVIGMNDLRKTKKQLLEELAELNACFDIRWNADIRARKKWEEKHNPQIWPDHSDLCVWLMEELEKYWLFEEMQKSCYSPVKVYDSEEGFKGWGWREDLYPTLSDAMEVIIKEKGKRKKGKKK